MDELVRLSHEFLDAKKIYAEMFDELDVDTLMESERITRAILIAAAHVIRELRAGRQ